MLTVSDDWCSASLITPDLLLLCNEQHLCFWINTSFGDRPNSQKQRVVHLKADDQGSKVKRNQCHFCFFFFWSVIIFNDLEVPPEKILICRVKLCRTKTTQSSKDLNPTWSNLRKLKFISVPKEKIKSTKCRQRLVENLSSRCKLLCCKLTGEWKPAAMPAPGVCLNILEARQKQNGSSSNPEKFLDQDYQQLKKYCLIRNLRFVDDMFPPDKSSIGTGLLSPSDLDRVEWLRPMVSWCSRRTSRLTTINLTWGLRLDLHVLSLSWDSFADAGCRLLFVKPFIWTSAVLSCSRLGL